MSALPLTPSRPIGRTGLAVSPLFLGANVFGWTADREHSFAVLDAYAAAGGNAIDTADLYSEWVPGHMGGESEQIIGSWMSARGNREHLVISTKVGMLTTARGLAPATIQRAIDDSLRRLQTDYVDLYYAHEDDPSVPIEEVVGTFAALITAGKVRHVGASNFSPERLSAALAFAAREGLPGFIAVQDQYNIMERTVYETTLAPIALAHDLASLPYFSLAQGFLTGKYRRGSVVSSPRAEGAQAYMNARGERVLTVLDTIAADHGCTVAAVSLAWLLTRPQVAAPLVSARTPEQLQDLIPGATLALNLVELDAIAEASN